MATVFDVSIVTNAGKALLQKVQANEDTMEFTKLVLGDGTWAAAAMPEATALKSQKNAYSISHSSRVSENLTLKAFLVNVVSGTSIVDADYQMKELGLIAENSDGDEILYGLAIPSGTPEIMPAFTGMNPMQIEQEWTITIGNATVTVDYSDAYASADDLEAEVQARKEADLIQKYDLVNKTTNIGIVDGNKHVLENYTDSGDTVDITIVKTSDTVKTVTTVVMPAEGNYKYTKTETITTTSSGKTIVTSVIRSVKGGN